MRILLAALILAGAAPSEVLRSSIHPHETAKKLAYAHLFGDTSFFPKELAGCTGPGDALKLASQITGRLSAEPLSDVQIDAIETLTAHFPNKKKAGYGISTFEELEGLEPHEVDLSSAMAVLQGAGMTRSERAALDWMAWTIEQRLSKKRTRQELVEAISHFIFFDLGIRFPPQSRYGANIDSYTFLSAVLSQRQGVCLGVSVLYLCLAERLGLDLEVVTPPGHIFVRAQIDGHERNIETTARGIDIPSEHYESVTAPHLKERNLKETAALTLINEASSMWHKKDYKKALERYELARRLMPNDSLVHELMGICSFLAGDVSLAHTYLRASLECPLELTICRDSLAVDILQARCDRSSVEAVFMPTDGSAKSLIAKTEALEKAVRENPYFRAGYFNLGCTYLERGYHKGAFEMLKKAASVDHEDPMCDMLLAQLHLERLEIDAAWRHLLRSEAYTGYGAVRDQRQLRFELLRRSPQAQGLSADPDVEYVDTKKKGAEGLWQWFFSSPKPK